MIHKREHEGLKQLVCLRIGNTSQDYNYNLKLCPSCSPFLSMLGETNKIKEITKKARAEVVYNILDLYNDPNRVQQAQLNPTEKDV